jgi:peptidylprolyl isomerase
MGQRATIRFLMVSGRTGKQIKTSYGWNPANILLQTTNENRVLVDTIAGTPVGSRVLVTAPSSDPFVAGLASSKALQRGDSVLVVIDLVDVHTPLTTATGTPGPAPLPGMPAVTDAGSGPPGVTIPPGAPSPDLQSATLVQGDGPKVEAGQNVLVQYEGIVWRTGQVFDSTWRSGRPAVIPIGVGRVITGWDNGLIGQAVGSRVLLVVPPDQAYGTGGNPAAGIKPGDALVFVIDVLDAWA